MYPWVQAETVYRWTDAQGQTHFSDLPPPSPSVTAITLQADSTRTPTGLRSGERTTLHAIELRLQARHRQVEAARRQQRSTRDRRRRPSVTATPLRGASVGSVWLIAVSLVAHARIEVGVQQIHMMAPTTRWRAFITLRLSTRRSWLV